MARRFFIAADCGLLAAQEGEEADKRDRIGQPIILECYFDRLDPIPIKAMGAFNAARSIDGADTSVIATATCDLFDACCLQVLQVEGDAREEVAYDKIGWQIKAGVVNRLMSALDVQVNMPGQSSSKTSQ